MFCGFSCSDSLFVLFDEFDDSGSLSIWFIRFVEEEDVVDYVFFDIVFFFFGALII